MHLVVLEQRGAPAGVVRAAAAGVREDVVRARDALAAPNTTPRARRASVQSVQSAARRPSGRASRGTEGGDHSTLSRGDSTVPRSVIVTTTPSSDVVTRHLSAEGGDLCSLSWRLDRSSQLL